MTITLKVEPQELDFICSRIMAGLMDFNTAMNAKKMVDKLVMQANDKTLQEPSTPSENKDGQAG